MLFSRAWLIQFVAAHIKYAVVAGAKVFPGNLRAEFEQLLVGKLFVQSSVKSVGDVRRRVGHGIRQFDDEPLNVGER